MEEAEEEPEAKRQRKDGDDVEFEGDKSDDMRVVEPEGAP